MLRLLGVELHIGERQLLALPELTVAPGEVVTLMGPSGSGKSTLLDFIGGTLTTGVAASGLVELDGRDVTGDPAERRGIGRLFQDDLLFPHMTVAENLLFGIPRGGREERLAAMRAALVQADLQSFEDHPPHTLSAGERTRVALMRALLAAPRVMLLDEPFSRLDAELRRAMRSFVFGHLGQRNIPALLVTHDLADAPPDGRVIRIGSVGALEP